MIRPAKRFVLCLVMILAPAPVSAQDTEPLTVEDLEFLEYLGEWESDEGQWVNPLGFLDSPSGDIEKTRIEQEPPLELGTETLPEQQGEYEW